ncbi:hypothetical protein [Planotetraspora mira]|nr:hypothetical protein [Planotetraspora mira]
MAVDEPSRGVVVENSAGGIEVDQDDRPDDFDPMVIPVIGLVSVVDA